MARALSLALIGLALLTAPPAIAQETLRASAVIDGDTLRLVDGRELRLAGIAAPKRPLGVADDRPWPLADKAKAALSALVEGRALRLAPEPPAIDRYGRLVAQLYVEASNGPPLWVQGTLLERGLARVEHWGAPADETAALLVLEATARSAGRGLWGVAFYAVRSPETVARDIGSFQLVEGCVAAAAKVRGGST